MYRCIQTAYLDMPFLCEKNHPRIGSDFELFKYVVFHLSFEVSKLKFLKDLTWTAESHIQLNPTRAFCSRARHATKKVLAKKPVHV